MKRASRTLAGVLSAAALVLNGLPAGASGPPPTGPWTIDAFAGSTADQARFYDGNIGVLMTSALNAQLFAAWRILHGQRVGAAIGKSLSAPCCGEADQSVSQASQAWLEARSPVPGDDGVTWIATDRQVKGGYGGAPNCLSNAFVTAAATVKARIASYGATSPEVVAWRNGQDQVFKACSADDAVLAPLAPGAPAWLKADRAYQAAALDFYSTRYVQAAQEFTAIARDAGSPWRPTATYLAARSLVRAAVTEKTPAAFNRARQALAAVRPGAYGHDDAVVLFKVLAYREHPDQMRAQLAAALSAPDLPPTAAADIKDLFNLSEKAASPPEMIDWASTLRTTRADGLARARARWTATHDPAWLLATLSLATRGDGDLAPLIAASRQLPPSSPGYLSAVYHRLRLTLIEADPKDSRAELDAILARTDLSVSARNLFTAERMQVAETPNRFAVLALRKRLCDDDAEGCVRGQYNEEMEPRGVYDGEAEKGTVGLGDDARLAIDRVALAQRADLAANPALPPRLQLDIALTSWTRAVLLQNNAVIDTLAQQLKSQLPQLSADWARVISTPPGPAKRFAEEFILAKLPGASTDLITYTRPEGGVAGFQGEWPDWLILAPGKPDPTSAAPSPLTYYPDAYSRGEPGDAPPPTEEQIWAGSDTVCYGLCGQGAFPLRFPDFEHAQAATAIAQRGYFVGRRRRYDDSPPPAMPPGAVSVWEEVLAYVAAHPSDPNAPEALHWLIHVGHYGASHDHSGKRAFLLLHKRYPDSVWAKKNKFYYD
jgi:hypothetical protein